MQINFTFNKLWWKRIESRFEDFKFEPWFIVILSTILAIGATYYSYHHDIIVSYGDAESHLNIAKRVIDGLTPGFAQLGGIWLPLPHLLMIPFVKFDFLWRTGLAGSIVSGLAYVVTSLFVYKLTWLLTDKKWPAILSSLVFMLNPNILYLQSTPMTELTLIVFFTMSCYYFIKFMKDDSRLLSLLLAALFAFCSALSRYDGWFLVLAEAGILILYYLPFRKIPQKWPQIREYWDRQKFEKLEGTFIIFATLAFIAIVAWLFWGFLILGDPLYFTHSQFSAKSQQQGWLALGQLPAYHNLWLSFLYYFATSMNNIGIIVFAVALVGFYKYIFNKPDKFKLLTILLLTSVFVFYVVTLYVGQSIIFIPSVTPPNFHWTMFNVRYGVMMVPLAAMLLGILFAQSKLSIKFLIAFLFLGQLGLFAIGFSKVVTYQDGMIGLSQAKRPDSERWLKEHYDGGLVLLDDYARLTSIVRSGIPMSNIIYIGNKPYWEDSLVSPEKYARWIIVQKDDTIWFKVYEPEHIQGRLYKYFEKAYTSPEVLIFKRNTTVSSL